MVRGDHVRPLPPSSNQIIHDINNSPCDDPVFKKICDAPAMSSETRSTEESTVDSNTHFTEVEACYMKVSDLLENLSSLQSGKDMLEKFTQELLSCKEEVSSMSLELKTRLEMHKLASTRNDP